MPAGFTGTPTGSVENWSPIIISNEMWRFRQSKLVLESRMWNRSQDALAQGKRVEFPVEEEPGTNPVSADRTPTPTAYVGQVKYVDIDIFEETSWWIGKDAEAQSKATKMLQNMKSRSYALAKFMDDYLWSALDDGTVTQTDNVEGAITVAQVRRLARYLEDQDAMEEGDCYLACGPADKDDITSYTAWSSKDFISGGKTPMETGQPVSNIAGLVPLVTTRARTDSNGRRRILAFQKKAMGIISQKKSPLLIDKQMYRTVYGCFILGGARTLDVNLAAFARVNPN